MKRLILIDGNSLMHRAYHGIKFAPVLNGTPVGMVYGFASMLINIIDEHNPDYLVTAFDTKEKTFRHKMDQEYKAHRVKADDEFYAQIPLIYKCLESFGVQTLKIPGYEADDIIGTLAILNQNKGMVVEIISSDLDYLQLVSDYGISLSKANGGIKDSIKFTPKETREKLGVSPEQIVDYKAIVGDSSDNYKGVPGVGPKTAVTLLNDFKTLNGVFNNLDKLSPKLSEKFRKNKDYAFHCYDLATIKVDVPLEFELNLFDPSDESIIAFLEEMKFYSLVARYRKLNNNIDHKILSEQVISSEYPSPDKQMSLF